MKKDITLHLDIDDVAEVSDELYELVLEAFRNKLLKMGHDPKQYSYETWKISAVAEPYEEEQVA